MRSKLSSHRLSAPKRAASRALCLITRAAQGEPVPVDILLVHAEDQLMSAEDFKILTERFINLARHACAKH